MPKALMLREQAKQAVPTKSVSVSGVVQPRKVGGRQKTPMLGKVLVPTDFSDEAGAGVRCAVSIAQKFGADVEFVYVVDTPPTLSRMRAEPMAMRNVSLERAAREKLEKLAEWDVGKDSEVTSFVTVGKPFAEIVDLARRHKVDVIVMSTRGHTGLKRMMLGSTAEYVVRHAQCPVLTVPSTWKERRFKPTKIFVPIDFSDLSRGALAYARLLADVYNAEIVLGHVVDMSALLGLTRTQLGHQLIVPALAEAKSNLEEWANELRQWTEVPVSMRVELGRPTEEVGATAKRAKADLIVLTTHGKTGLKRMLIGSTAESIVRHAGCPVLVVRGAKPRMLGF